MGLGFLRTLRAGQVRRRARILIISEFEPYLELLLDTLHQAGYRPRGEHPRDALELAEAGDYDVVVSGLMLPYLSGLDLLSAVRAPWTRVILLTGDPDSMLAAAALERGAFAVLDKRSMDELTRFVEEAVDQALLARQTTSSLSPEPLGIS